MGKKDKLAETLILLINSANEPLETKEIEGKVPTETRTKVIYRLRDLAVKSEIKGKSVGAGKGTWIWWRKTAFPKDVGAKQ